MTTPLTYAVETGEGRISVHEWPGSGAPILLLHATGFHGRCWDKVVAKLGDRQVYAPDLPFHGGSDVSGPVNWLTMADTIVRVIEALQLRQIVGAGHSIGGFLLARAAALRPAIFQRLVLIDPVIAPPQRYAGAAAHVDLDAHTHPVSRRKNRWTGPQEMFDRFATRVPFTTWDTDVLRDYCDHALVRGATPGHFRLACDPLDEARIYLSQAGNEVIYDALPGLNMPVTLLRAPFQEDAQPGLAGSPTNPELAALLPDCTEVYLPGHNHFIPMQDPELVAGHILGLPD